MRLVLRKWLFEDRILGLSQKLSRYDKYDTICIDFSSIRHWIPAGIIILFLKLKEWIAEDKEISFLGLDSDAAQYFQRMNFFDLLEIEIDEKFKRRNPADRFVPIIGVGKGITIDTDKVALRVAEVISPEAAGSTSKEGKQIHKGIYYSISELARNVVDHAKAPGFVFSQYNSEKDFARIAMGDLGIGIKRSFEESNSPFLKEGMDDLSIIMKALEYEVSSKSMKIFMGEPQNAGVGLTFLRELVREAGFSFIVVSNRGYYELDGIQHNHQPHNLFNGTVVAITLHRGLLSNFSDVLKRIRLNFI